MPQSRSVKIAAALVFADYWLRGKKTKGQRRMWISDWTVRREVHGAYSNLPNELRMEESQQEGTVYMTLNIPDRSPLKERQLSMPYVIAADGAFGLTTYLMKPYP